VEIYKRINIVEARYERAMLLYQKDRDPKEEAYGKA